MTSMNKAAFACNEDRIAPVFDTARRVRLVEAGSGRILAASEEALGEEMPARRAARLEELGAGTLVCGAISRPLHEMVASRGILVIPFVAGDLDEIVAAWLSGALRGDAFAMPGCCGRRGRGFRGRGRRGGFGRGWGFQ